VLFLGCQLKIMSEITELEKQLNTFYINFPYTKLNVGEDMIVYKIPLGYCLEVAKEANELIERLNLNLLEAKANSKHGIFNDSVVVKAK
jgi:hypothetical protein